MQPTRHGRFVVNTQRLMAVVLGSLVLGGCAVAPEEDPVYIRMNDLDARVQRIERVLTNQSLLELAQRIDALQSELRTMRGEVELLQNQSEGGKVQSRSLYGDLEKRLAALETLGGVGAVAPPAAGVPSTAGSAASEQTSYDGAMAALRGGDYARAITGFREVVTNYPQGDLAGNAQFWIGESYYTKGDLENAITAYRKVIADWPQSRKAPDAMVKLGFSLSDLKRTGEARSTLEEVVRKFPGSTAASLAADRLKRMTNAR
jgi:tol-pal system protein YbgF